MVADTVAVTPTAGSTLALGQKIRIEPIEADFDLGNKPGRSIVARVASSEDPMSYRIESSGLPKANRHVLSWTRNGWRYWRYNGTTNPTCLVTVEKVTAAPQYPPIAGDSGRD